MLLDPSNSSPLEIFSQYIQTKFFLEFPSTMRQWAHAGSVFPLVEFGCGDEVGVEPSVDGVEDDIVDDLLIQKVTDSLD